MGNFVKPASGILRGAAIASGDLPTITLTSDVTGSGSSGSIATTVSKIQGTSVTGTTGSGNVVFATSPTLSNPVVGTQAQTDSSTLAASTAYVTTAVSNAVAGINPAVAVQAATTSSANTTGFTYNNGVSGVGATLTSTSNNTALTVDGFTFTAVGQRLLVKDHATPADNGIYSVTQLQASLLPLILTRATDYDMPSDINNTGAIPVINGTVNGTTSWVETALVNTIGTDSITFARFTRNPADYLLKANNLSDVASPSASFNNISPITSTGDLIVGTGTNTSGRLAIGSTGNVLTVSGGTAVWGASTTPTLTSLGIFAGKASVTNGSTSVSVTFSTAFGSTNYAITGTFLNTVDTAPQFQPLVVTAQSTTGATFSWNAPVSTANYSILWSAIASN